MALAGTSVAVLLRASWPPNSWLPIGCDKMLVQPTLTLQTASTSTPTICVDGSCQGMIDPRSQPPVHQRGSDFQWYAYVDLRRDRTATIEISTLDWQATVATKPHHLKDRCDEWLDVTLRYDPATRTLVVL